MPDANGLLEALKKSALDAMESKKPVNIEFGEVTSITPLKINVEQKMMLGEKQLILSENVTDFETEVTVDWQTESSLEAHTHSVNGTDSSGGSISLTTGEKNLTHDHEMTGRKKIIVHNGLVVGDEVILLRVQEGQKFIVWDRVGK